MGLFAVKIPLRCGAKKCTLPLPGRGVDGTSIDGLEVLVSTNGTSDEHPIALADEPSDSPPNEQAVPTQFTPEPPLEPSTWLPPDVAAIWASRVKLPYIPTFSDKINKCIGGGLRATGTYVCTGGPGVGKAQPLDAKVLTPRGFVPIGAIRVGDDVIGVDGKPHVVIGVFPQGKREVFRVVTSDKRATETCADHLWFTRTRSDVREGRPGQVRTLSEIRKQLVIGNDRLNHRLPQIAPVHFEADPILPLHPYVLGALLGDGCLKARRFTNPETDIRDRVANFLPVEDEMGEVLVDGMTCQIRKRVRTNLIRSKTHSALCTLGLESANAYNKFIPAVYLTASIEDRLEVLRGLFDTDGHVDKDHVEYASASPRLRDDVVFLVRSLGGIATLDERVPHFSYKGERRAGAISYRAIIHFNNDVVPIASLKHNAKWRVNHHQSHVKIAEITLIGKKECVCIAIDSVDRLYITDDFIPTHNSTMALDVADAAIQHGFPVIYVSSELTSQLLLARFAAKKLGAGWLEMIDSDDPKLTETSEALFQSVRRHLWVLDPEQAQQFPLYVREIRSRLSREVGYQVMPLVIIDYIQDLAQPRVSRGKDHRTAVGEISRELRMMAEREFLPIWIVSSTSRSFYANAEETDDSMLIASAKESGEVEYNVNALFHVRRRDTGSKKNLELMIVKNRFGENPVSVVFGFNPKTGAMFQTSQTGEQLALESLKAQVYELIKLHPGKFTSAKQIAATLGVKLAVAKFTLDSLETDPYQKITANKDGLTGYFVTDDAPEIFS